MFRLRHAPLLPVFVPYIEGDWLAYKNAKKSVNAPEFCI
jgi:hypothetical protein